MFARLLFLPNFLYFRKAVVKKLRVLTFFNCKTAPAICKSVQWALIQVVVKRK